MRRSARPDIVPTDIGGSSDDGFGAIASSVQELEARYGKDLVAFGLQTVTSEVVAHTTYFYQQLSDGSLKPMATVRGSSLGGEDFHPSKSGHAVVKMIGR